MYSSFFLFVCLGGFFVCLMTKCWMRYRMTLIWTEFNLLGKRLKQISDAAGKDLLVVLGFFLFVFLKFIYLFIFYLWLCCVFVSVRGLSLVAASGGHSSSRCVGLSLSWPLLLRSTGSRRAGSAVVAHGPSRLTACGILPDQGSNPCPPH